MNVIGVDFGTSNVRIAKWDSAAGGEPSVMPIGDGGATIIPAVVAFEKLTNGKLRWAFGD